MKSNFYSITSRIPRQLMKDSKITYEKLKVFSFLIKVGRDFIRIGDNDVNCHIQQFHS